MLFLKKGDKVNLTCDGRIVEAVVILASKNGHSLMFEFEAILNGNVGRMAVSQKDDGKFVDVMTGIQLFVEKKGGEATTSV